MGVTEEQEGMAFAAQQSDAGKGAVLPTEAESGCVRRAALWEVPAPSCVRLPPLRACLCFSVRFPILETHLEEQTSSEALPSSNTQLFFFSPVFRRNWLERQPHKDPAFVVIQDLSFPFTLCELRFFIHFICVNDICTDRQPSAERKTFR